MEPQERKKRMLVILILHLQMLNCFTLLIMVICYLVLSRRLKKRKRSRDCDERRLKIAFRKDKARAHAESSDEGDFGLNLNDDETIESPYPKTPTYNTAKVARLMDQSHSDASLSGGGKKRVKYDGDDDEVSESLITSLNKLGEVYAQAAESIQQLTSCFIHQKQTADRRNQVASVLEEIEGLSTTEMIRAAILITSNDNLCDCFFTMDTLEMKKQFVDIVLNNNDA
ncbi:uncharacterized protein LOC130716650 isoform X1 [Lotus japonicus]|uniref:uncharacterized protein LOC130716650 isoform X1 n=1 Tax=Lotus japonicus TaxID=34305 RepID=UPI0025829577|nr:uncharacterized protein LOC130716650 isoform X1 [Lotus japonicus]XP_057422619.1 uncharacterized protein LOC130716650 isoform X1 [Lotus japonicus]